MPLIILVGTLAAALGDNLGYWGGRKLGQRFLVRFKRWFHVDAQDIALGQDLIQRKGRQAIFAARFLLGLRILAGPLAGILKMDWKRFLLFNLMGAATWVSVIVPIGYASAHKFNTLLEFFEKADLALTVAMAAIGLYCWHRYKRSRQTWVVLSVEGLPAGHRHSSRS